MGACAPADGQWMGLHPAGNTASGIDDVAGGILQTYIQWPGTAGTAVLDMHGNDGSGGHAHPSEAPTEPSSADHRPGTVGQWTIDHARTAGTGDGRPHPDETPGAV